MRMIEEISIMIGKFTKYVPDKPAFGDALYLRRKEDGADWYEVVKGLPVEQDQVYAVVNEHGDVIAVDADPSMVFPENASLYQVRGVDVRPGWRMDRDGRFGINIDHKRKIAAQALVKMIDDAAGRIIAGAARAEKDGWPVKEQAARAVVGGNARPDQIAILQAEADLTGEELDALAGRIVAKAEAWAALSGRLAGIRRVASAKIGAADGEDEIRQALDDARAALDVMAADENGGE